MSQMENKHQTKRLNPKYIILNITGLKIRVDKQCPLAKSDLQPIIVQLSEIQVFFICLIVFYILKGYKEMHQ